MTSPECVFCRIIAGAEPAAHVLQNESCAAFLDRHQARDGHVLVVPLEHIPAVWELSDQLAGRLFATVRQVAAAVMQAFHAPGLSIWQSNGTVAGQEIDHVHIHVQPRYPDDGILEFYRDRPARVSLEDRERIAARIRAAQSPST
mgnify:FL=1